MVTFEKVDKDAAEEVLRCFILDQELLNDYKKVSFEEMGDGSLEDIKARVANNEALTNCALSFLSKYVLHIGMEMEKFQVAVNLVISRFVKLAVRAESTIKSSRRIEERLDRLEKLLTVVNSKGSA